MDLVGSIALEIAKASDGGQAKWDHACRAQEQLQKCSDHVSRKKEHVFVFGGLLAFGIWDGLSDVDFASINIEKWKESGEKLPPQEVEQTSVERMNNCLLNIGLPKKSMQALTLTRVPIVKHKGPEKGKSQIQPAKRNMVKVCFNKTVREMNTESLQSQINVHGIPYKACDMDERRYAMVFEFNSVPETIEFALAVPYDVENYKLTDVYPSYTYAPEISSVDFDLSFRAFGVRNSWLLRHYLMQHRCARLGAIIIKKWAKNTGFSDSRNGYLTSYAAVILWIFYLLEHNYITNFVSPRDIPSIPLGSESLRGLYQPLLDEHDAHDPQELQHELGTLLHGFYKYYGAEFDWETRVVSLNHRGGSTKERLGWTLDKQVTSADHIADNVFYLLCIEDPYEDNLNLGRRIDDVKFGRIIELFRNAVVGLESPEPGNSPVFRKPTPMDQETASSRILQAIADSLAENTKSGGNGLAIDKLAREVCSKHYEAWSAIQEKYENRISNLLWEKGKKIAYVQDRMVLPAKPRVVRGHEVTSRAGGRMPCDQCRKMSQKLWYAANQKEDPGAYCDSCWNKYESA